eukprot:7940450-Prorocentrum_lima.AAC.1
MRQEATHEAVKLESDEKHMPENKPTDTKPKDIGFGNDDRGEDMPSIAWVEEIPCPFDLGAP